MQDHHKISLLVGVGAVAVLIYLLMHRASATGSNGSAIPDESVEQAPAYPQNPVPSAASDIEIGGSPVNLTYNYGEPLPTLALGGNTAGECGCDTYCETAGQKVTVQNVPPDVFAAAQDNYTGFQAKQKAPVVTFTQPIGGAALVQPSSVGGRLG